MQVVHGNEVFGVDVDEQTRCAHWNSELDIIAIKFKCCRRWFPCFECHKAIANHDAEVWPARQRDAKVILCGACGKELSMAEYLESGSACPACGSGFNPGCANHYHLYFE